MSLLQQASCQQEDSQQTREEVSGHPVPIPDFTEYDKQNTKIRRNTTFWYPHMYVLVKLEYCSKVNLI